MDISRLLGLSGEMISDTKIHFAIGSDAKKRFEPLHAFYRDEFKEWQENQRNKNFEKPYIFSLIYFEKDEWLFAGVFKRVNVVKNIDKYKYETELLDLAPEFIGKLVIKFKKKFRNSYTFLENSLIHFELLEILREKYTIMPFPGYENVRISFDFLKSIIKREEKSWKTALSNVKGVYLISDESTGKLYVGAAYNENAFWNRWKEYSENGHGANVELKKVLDKNGFDYASNFQFSILETRSMNAEDDEVTKREKFWKDMLLTRKFGYNIT